MRAKHSFYILNKILYWFFFSACNCFTAGSHLWNTCDQYGGQCKCKEGYGGRACDNCIPGYYGDPSVGCLSKFALKCYDLF